MKVGLSTTMIQRGKGGIGQYVFALVKAMLRERPDVRLHLFVLREDVPLFEFAGDRVEIIPVDEALRSPIKNILFHQRAVPAEARRRGLDLLHVPSYRRMIWSQKVPTVATIHDLAPFHVAGKYNFARMFYGKVIVKQIARRQQRIIAISQNTAKDIEAFFGIPRKRQKLILNGIDHERFRPGEVGSARAAVAAACDLRQPYFLYISRLEHPAKNHVRLIEAYEHFRRENASDWQLVLGGGDWHGAEVIHQRAAESEFAADIRFLGFVKDEIVPDLYRAAGAFVYPSLFEGFGLPPAEAMACGCPVISSTAGSLGEVVADAAAIIDPEKVGDLTTKLTHLATNEATRTKLIAKGLENVKRFDWGANARAVASVYDAITGRDE
ncbi:MAG: glycosyltransferase family 4 protein [Verrucomicrobiae bacterium]|nr:glycosyltransferase family 4 protein [Verrucomicrobiae bacterium]